MKHLICSALGKLLLIALGAAVPFVGCGPNDECEPEESRCEGNTAANCSVANSDMHKVGNPYVWQRYACPRACVMIPSSGGAPKPHCAISTQPEPRCSTSGSFCDGNRLVYCTAGYAVDDKVCERTCAMVANGTAGYCQ